MQFENENNTLTIITNGARYYVLQINAYRTAIYDLCGNQTGGDIGKWQVAEDVPVEVCEHVRETWDPAACAREDRVDGEAANRVLARGEEPIPLAEAKKFLERRGTQ